MSITRIIQNNVEIPFETYKFKEFLTLIDIDGKEYRVKKIEHDLEKDVIEIMLL